MAKAKVPPKRPAKEATASRTIPLSEISITWPYQGPWDDETKERTITGAQLARFLNRLGLYAFDDPDQAKAGVQLAAHRLQGLSELLNGVVEGPTDIDNIAAFGALSAVMRDFAFELRSEEDFVTKRLLEGATVRINGAPGTEVA